MQTIQLESTRMHTLVFHVQNHHGTLQRIAGIFSRRGVHLTQFYFNGRANDLTEVQLSFEADERMREHVERQIEKLLDLVP